MVGKGRFVSNQGYRPLLVVFAKGFAHACATDARADDEIIALDHAHWRYFRAFRSKKKEEIVLFSILCRTGFYLSQGKRNGIPPFWPHVILFRQTPILPIFPIPPIPSEPAFQTRGIPDTDAVIGVSIDQVSKRFGEVLALDSVTLSIEPGEIFFLLGPSGCGKTTLLRCLAGFHFPDSGTIRFGADDVTRLPAHRRHTGMVFQNYALWPHKTVAENVAFGLEERGATRESIRTGVAEALESVRMEGYGTRAIHQLSGGQQQRVALARALVVRPRCLLLDEPLSNLDAKLRLEMRTEIRRICKETGLTAIYVTHDQKEALSVADRLAVLNEGRVCQVGAPGEVYRRPKSRFVADFIGETNFLDAEVIALGEGTLLAETGSGHRFEAVGADFRLGDKVTLSIRPEAWRLVKLTDGAPQGDGVNAVSCQIGEVTYLGEMAQYRVTAGAIGLKIYEMNPRVVTTEGACYASVAAEDVVVLPRR